MRELEIHAIQLRRRREMLKRQRGATTRAIKRLKRIRRGLRRILRDLGDAGK